MNTYFPQWIPGSLFPRPPRAWVRGYTHWCTEFQQWSNDFPTMQDTTDWGEKAPISALDCKAMPTGMSNCCSIAPPTHTYKWVRVLASCLAIVHSLPSQAAVVYHRHLQDAKFTRCLLECVYALFWGKWSWPLKEPFLLPTSICNLFKVHQRSTFWVAGM